MITEEWAEYEQLLIGLGAPPMQRFECKKAFYMGAALCLELAGPEKESLLATMHTEVRQFIDQRQADTTASNSAE